MIADLCILLNEQTLILEKMLQLSQEERRVIICGEAELLEGIVRQELRELSKLGAIEKKRLALHGAISTEFDLPKQNLNVSAIAERAAPDERKLIKRIQTELTDLIAQHTAINAENRELISAHIEYSDLMLDLLVDSEDPLNNFYGEDGKSAPDKKKSTGFFDGHA